MTVCIHTHRLCVWWFDLGAPEQPHLYSITGSDPVNPVHTPFPHTCKLGVHVPGVVPSFNPEVTPCGKFPNNTTPSNVVDSQICRPPAPGTFPDVWKGATVVPALGEKVWVTVAHPAPGAPNAVAGSRVGPVPLFSWVPPTAKLN